VTVVSKFHLIWCPIALSDKVRNSRTLFGPTPDIVRPRVFTPTFVHCFGHSLLFGCPIDPIFSCCVHNFEWIIYTLLVCVFIAFLQCFGFGIWTWDIDRFLQKNLIRLSFTPSGRLPQSFREQWCYWHGCIPKHDKVCDSANTNIVITYLNYFLFQCMELFTLFHS
jgi:hypothetical protein